MTENNSPQWKRLYIQSKVPDKLEMLEKLANNLWWCWQYDAIELFKNIDPQKWEELHHNPIALLDQLDYEDFQRLQKDDAFISELKRIGDRFQKYMKAGDSKKGSKIGYFCMEYGLHASFKLYSGGLGVLAGDFLKEASDENVDMVGIGLLYRYGYFRQELSLHGDQIAHYDSQRFTYLPIEPVRDPDGNWVKIQVDLPERVLTAKVWKAKVGRIPLYLMDTDIEENREDDKFISHQLYGGDRENRLKQEILLGIGGVRVLDALGITPDVYHLNEGHAAFISLERLRKYVKSGLNFGEASEVIRSSSLFTTHTPVPAGHDSFHEGLMWNYFNQFANSLSLSWEKFIGLGRLNPYNKEEEFSMSHLAARMSQEMNGVSKIHGKVSQDMFAGLYPGYQPNELHIDYVTNSVHYPTWTALEWQKLHAQTFGKGFIEHQEDAKFWQKISKVSDAEVFGIKQKLKKDLLNMIKNRLELGMKIQFSNPRKVMDIIHSLSENKLIFGFARRFATYKRAQLLFRNPERLAKIVNNPDYPVQFIFAGKAHPADKAGQGLIKYIYELSGQPEFLGKVIFLEDYDMDIASAMVKGVDVWLNTPTRPLEASGTSGMKATMNGVMNFSVLDGWFAEGFRPDAGWALPEERSYENQENQDELDAETIYNKLENEIIPEYFQKDDQGVSAPWVHRIKQAISYVAPQFTMKRMMDDYHEKFYLKLAERYKMMQASDFATAKELANWKAKTISKWNALEVVEKTVYNTDNQPLPLGEDLTASIILQLGELSVKDVGVELLIAEKTKTSIEVILSEELKPKKPKKKAENNQVTYECKQKVKFAGVFEYGFRVFAKNDLLPHRQDFNLVAWL